MRTLVVATLIFATGCTGDLVLPDDVTPGEIAGANANDWWLGMPRESPGELALDARLTRYASGAFTRLNTIDLCRGACRHIGYGGNGLLALDNSNEGIQLVDATGAITLLPFPLDEAEQAGPWLLDGRGDTLVAAAGVLVFERAGDGWNALPDLDEPAFAVDVEPHGVIVATRDVDGVLLPAALVGEEWIGAPDPLVAFAPDGSLVSAASIAPPDADAFVPLRMFSAGLLAARLVGTTLDAVVVDESGGVTTWASLGGAESVNEASFRATVFEDGTVGVLYPGAPRDQGVGPKTVLHVGTAP